MLALALAAAAAAAAAAEPAAHFDAAEAAFQAEEQLLRARSSAEEATGNVPLDLVMLTDAQSKDKGAVCLDGTNPGCERQHLCLPACCLRAADMRCPPPQST